MKKATTNVPKKKEHRDKVEKQDGTRHTRNKEKVDTATKKLPLIGKSIYLDIKDASSLKVIERDIRFLGAKVETFLSREINYVITSQQWTKASASAAKMCSPESPAAVSTPSPFNCGGSPAASTTEKKGKTVTRGKAMVQNARTESKNNVLEMAEQWGAKIVPVDSAKKWIEKEKAKFKPEELAKEKEKVKNEKKKNYKSKKLQKPFVKYEADNQQYRPIYKHIESWPFINMQTSRGVPPFMVNCPASYSSASEAEDRDAPSQGPKASDNKVNISSKLKEKSEAKSAKKSCKEDVDESVCLRGIPILTAGDIKRRKDIIKKQRQRAKPGYCECCQSKFEDLDKHLRSDHHKAFSRDKSNYENLDCLIEGGPSTVRFLKNVLIRHCAKQPRKNKSSRTDPQTSADSSKKCIDEPKHSPRPMGIHCPPAEKNTWSPLKRRTKRPTDYKSLKITVDATLPSRRSVSALEKTSNDFSLLNQSSEKKIECPTTSDVHCCPQVETANSSVAGTLKSSEKPKTENETVDSLASSKQKLDPVLEHLQSSVKLRNSLELPSTQVVRGHKNPTCDTMPPAGSKSPVFKKSPLARRNRLTNHNCEDGSCVILDKSPRVVLEDVSKDLSKYNGELSSAGISVAGLDGSKDSDDIKSPRSGISYRTSSLKKRSSKRNRKTLDFESMDVKCSTPSLKKSDHIETHNSQQDCDTPKRDTVSQKFVSPVSSISSEKKYKVLSDRSLIKLLASENDDVQSFKGFDIDGKKNDKVSSDFTYIEISDIDVGLDSDCDSPDEKQDESRLSEESDSDETDSEKSSIDKSDASSNNDFKDYFRTITFTSPSKKSASSWGDACEEYLNVLSMSNSRLVSPSYSGEKSNKSKKSGKKRHSGKSRRGKKKKDLEQVDPDILFNFSSPQKQRHDFSPLKMVGNHVVCAKRKSRDTEDKVSKRKRSARKVLCVD